MLRKCVTVVLGVLQAVQTTSCRCAANSNSSALDDLLSSFVVFL